MEKINIAEILRGCPRGTLLYATIHGEVKLSRITSSENYPIEVELDSGLDLFTEDGRIYPNKGECVLFPSKDQRDWSKFQGCFKDGDIVVNQMGKPFILKSYDSLKNNVCSYCGIDCWGSFRLGSEDWTVACDVRYATEEEKQKLFQAIKDNGYRWNPKTKMEKLITPKFNVGDRIKKKGDYISSIITDISDSIYKVKYKSGGVTYINIKSQDDWELVLDKFDITTLKPFESRVLVRDYDDDKWHPGIWGFYDKDAENYPYKLIGDIASYCIPYEGNEHLLGKTDDCAEFYKTWK